MQSKVPSSQLSESSVEPILERILSSRRLTRADQDVFMSLLLAKPSLTESEQSQVNRIFDNLRSGRLKVVD